MDVLQLLGLGGAAIGGGLLTKDAIDRLSKIGEQSVIGTQIGDVSVPGAMELAQTGLEQTQFRPFTVTSTTGGAFGVTPQVDPVTGEVTSLGATMTLSPREQAIQGMLMREAKEAFGDPIYGQMMGRQAGRQAFGLGEEFMGAAGMPTADREAEVYERMRAVQSPEEQRQRLALEERLAGQGRLGVRTAMFGGTPEQMALSQAQEEARNRAALSAIQQAQAEQMQQGRLAQAFTGLGSQLSAQDQALLAAQQQRGLGALAGAYVPQAQLLNVQQAAQLFPQLQQRGQLAGAGLFGETAMTGLEARLIAEQAKANLLGNLGSGLLSGLVSPVSTGSGVTSLLTQALSDVRLKDNIQEVGSYNGFNFYTWDWTEEGKRIAGNQIEFGVLAQEVLVTHPDAVVVGDDGYFRVNYAEILGDK
jgi:hypothetical protein